VTAYFIRRSSDGCSVIKLHSDNEEEVVQSGLTLLEAEILCAAKIADLPKPAAPNWVDAKSGKRFDVFNPATGQTVAAVAEADADDIDAAVKAARRAFESGPWAKISPADRCKLIWKLADLLETHADEIAEIESLDNGKPIRDARSVDLPG
jgi:delta 1-pyrroline-5-carboxylate dehydrogenase